MLEPLTKMKEYGIWSFPLSIKGIYQGTWDLNMKLKLETSNLGIVGIMAMDIKNSKIKKNAHRHLLAIN